MALGYGMGVQKQKRPGAISRDITIYTCDSGGGQPLNEYILEIFVLDDDLNEIDAAVGFKFNELGVLRLTAQTPNRGGSVRLKAVPQKGGKEFDTMCKIKQAAHHGVMPFKLICGTIMMTDTSSETTGITNQGASWTVNAGVQAGIKLAKGDIGGGWNSGSRNSSEAVTNTRSQIRSVVRGIKLVALDDPVCDSLEGTASG